MKKARFLTLLLILVAVVALYRDPFLILWWPQDPAQMSDHVILNMATESIDDMYDGCRREIAAVIDFIGAFERGNNKGFTSAWAAAERHAKMPAHQNLKQEHAVVLYLYTDEHELRRDFNTAVKEGKRKYGTHEFQFHHLYFYLTDAIQMLNHNQTTCMTCYLRTSERYNVHALNTKIRFGTFVWAASSKQTFESNGKGSCFEIHSCFGADVTFYSAKSQRGQALIPPYEVFTVTNVMTDDQWCSVVYKLQSTKMPWGDLNCKLNPQQIQKIMPFV
ncbi:GPI-linked NAD(P)(+)--arginine ADP-ribosyltransferase 1-like [Festucalex cinctus]